MTRIGILDCDELAPELKPAYKSYTDMFMALLAPVDGDLSFKAYSVLQHELPEKIDECDAYLITGSKTGVYDDEPWLPVLARFIERAFEAGIPLVGFCFGHQMLANTLGGRAQKSDLGWGVGALVHQKQLEEDAPDWCSALPEHLRLLYSHQDQVVELPPGAKRLYGSQFCPNGAFYFPHKVLAFQGHPEFSKDYMAGLMALSQSRYRPGQYQQGLDSLHMGLDNELVASWVADFVKDASTQVKNQGAEVKA